MGKLHSVHRTRHIDVGEDETDIIALLKNRDGIIRIFCLNDLKAIRLDELDCVHSDQEFVLYDKHNRSRASFWLHLLDLPCFATLPRGQSPECRVTDTSKGGERGF